jgi:hypothetical protein
VIELRDDFKSEIDSLYTQALATESLIATGIRGAREHVAQFGEVPAFFGAGHPDAPVRLAIKQIPVSGLASTYFQRRGLLKELFHGRIVRSWYDFLTKVFDRLLKAYFDGEIDNIAAGHLQPKQIELDRNVEGDLGVAVRGMLLTSFTFATTDNQMQVIADTLHRNLSPPLVTLIRKHTVVRNCFEHSGGIVRDQDTRRLGVATVNLTNDAAELVRFSPGERLTISVWDIEDLVLALSSAADELSP